MHGGVSSQSRKGWVPRENRREAPSSACIGRGAQPGEEGEREEEALSSRMSGHQPRRGEGRIRSKGNPLDKKQHVLCVMTEGKGVVRKMGDEATSAFYNEMLFFHMEGCFANMCTAVLWSLSSQIEHSQCSSSLMSFQLRRNSEKFKAILNGFTFLFHSLIFVIRCLGPK